MAMGRSDAVHDDLMATWAEMPRSPGHAFYDRLQELLREAVWESRWRLSALAAFPFIDLVPAASGPPGFRPVIQACRRRPRIA